MIDRRARRSLRAAAVLALGLSAAVLPGAARAQFFGGWGGWDEGGTWDGLSPQQVRRSIAQHGFRVVAPLRRNGSVFVADVVDGRGQRQRLIVAAADAQILQRFLIDDGRGPSRRGGDAERGFAARGDDDRGLVPPADIPDGGRRFARPADRDVPPQRLGDLGAPADQVDPDGGDAPLLRRNPPPIRTVKPRPRTVERAPDFAAPGREPGAVESTPLAPAAAPRPVAPAAVAVAPAPGPAAVAPAPVVKAAPASTAPAPAPAAPPPAVVASRPDPAPTASTPPAAAAAPAQRRMADPLAIPGGDAANRPVRSVATGITGAPGAPAAPAAAPAKPAPKPADVPVAPLD